MKSLGETSNYKDMFISVIGILPLVYEEYYQKLSNAMKHIEKDS